MKENLLKDVWRYAYAWASFQEVITFTDTLQEFITVPPSIPQRALSIATLVAYSRPFKQTKVQRIPNDVIPSAHAELHSTILLMRDKVIAHQDPVTPRTSFGNLNRVSFRLAGEYWESHTTFPIIPPRLAQEIQAVAGILQKECSARIDSMIGAVRQEVLLQDGDYIIEPEDGTGAFTIRKAT